MTSYGVGVTNKFSLLDDEDDMTTQKAAPAKVAAKPAAAGAVAQPSARKAGAVAGVEEEARRESTKRHSEARRGARGGRGRGGRGRDFDRHVSGTGRGKEMKKGGAGGHNWGEATEEAVKVADTEKTEQPAEVVEGEAAEAPEAAVEQAEPEKPDLGLEDYYKQLESQRANLPKIEAVREVSEDQFAGLTFYARPGTEDVSPNTQAKQRDASQRSKKVMSFQSFVQETGGMPAPAFRQERPERSERPARGGRGGRGGRGDGAPRGRGENAPRGNAPRGGARRGGRGADAPNIMDSSSFPSLAGKA